jgi:hypothetical protein
VFSRWFCHKIETVLNSVEISCPKKILVRNEMVLNGTSVAIIPVEKKFDCGCGLMFLSEDNVRDKFFVVVYALEGPKLSNQDDIRY